jgi:hypothetical protein
MIGGASDTPGESRSRSESSLSTGSRFTGTGKLVQVWLSLSLGPLFKLLATHHHHPASESLPSITAGRVRVSESGPASGRPGEPLSSLPTRRLAERRRHLNRDPRSSLLRHAGHWQAATDSEAQAVTVRVAAGPPAPHWQGRHAGRVLGSLP